MYCQQNIFNKKSSMIRKLFLTRQPRGYLVVLMIAIMLLRAESSTRATLARSGLQSTVTYPGSPRNASYMYGQFTPFTAWNDTNTSFVWDGPGNNELCNMNISLREDFILKCPGQKMHLLINADNSFNFTLLSKTGSGADWTKTFDFEIDVSGVACNQVISLYVDARNDNHTGGVQINCLNNPAGVAYLINQKDCICNISGRYYNWQICGCSPCITKIQGCISCNSPSSTQVVCTSCATTKGWTLSNGVCVCSGSRVTTVGCLNCVTSGSPCPACDSTSNFQLSGGSCVCSSGYALVSGSCVTCSSVMPNCATCSSSSTCLNCTSTNYVVSGANCVTCATVMTGCKKCSSISVCLACLNTSYTLISSACQLCSTPMPGCLTCSSSSMCTTCDTAGFYQKTGSKCVCISGYTQTGPTCSSCFSQMTGCAVCSSASVCTNCDTPANFQANGANGCQCKAGYTLVGIACQTCSSLMPGCSACTSPSTCTTCDSALHLVTGATGCVCEGGYVMDGTGTCLACSSTIDANCLTCSSTATCTSCVAGFGVSPTGTSCVSCSTIHPACHDCSGSTCLSCDSALYFTADATSGCVCTAPTAVSAGPGVCALCSTISDCLQCSSLASCDVCQDGFYPGGAGCLPCETGCDICTGPINACTLCDEHYYSIPVQACQQCWVLITGCDTCTSAGMCLTCNAAQNLVINGIGACECLPGYYDNAGTCALCSSAMTGCTSCTAFNDCDACDASLFRQISSDSCICISGYVVDPFGSGSCVLCSSVLPNCQTCTSGTTCTLCDSTYGVWLTTAAAGTCELCSTLISNCELCTDSGSCSTCATGYTSDGSGGCQLCTVTLANCAECSSTATCTLCSTATQAPNGVGVCTNCALMMAGCLTCTSSTDCTLCDTAGGFDFNNTECGCVAPLLIQSSTNSCQTCIVLQPLCQVCESATYCSDCLDGAYLTGVVGSQTCTQCPQGCLTCISNLDCNTCDSSIHYTLVGTMCDCQVGYTVGAGGVCMAVCGDGLVATEEECDDGNIFDGDGCDFTCHVQPDFSCFAFPGDSSICSYNKPLSMILNNVTKESGSNSLTLNLQIGPMLPNLSNINFSSILSSNLPLSNPRVVINTDGSLSVTYDYNSTLDGSTLQLALSPSGASENYFAVPPTTIDIPLDSVNNEPITFYNQSVYERQQQYDSAYKGGLGASYAILAIGLICDKVNGVELFGAWQVAFLSLSTINKVQPFLAPLMKLGMVNGINSMVDFNSSAVPNRVSAIDYAAEFLHNVNYMLVLVLADLLIGTILYVVGSFVPKYKEKMQEVGLRMLKEYFLMLVLFNSFNIAYSAGLQFTYCETLISLNSAVAVLALLLPIGAGVAVTVADPKHFGEFKAHYRPDIMSQLYFLCTIVFRMALGACMSQMNEVEEATIINFFLAMIFGMYLLTNTPYMYGYQNYRAMVDHSSILVSLFVAMFYRSMKSTTDIAVASQILDPALLSVVSLYLSLGVSAAALGYELYLKFRKQEVKPKSLAEELPSQQQDTMEAVQDDNHIDSDLAIENVFNRST